MAALRRLQADLQWLGPSRHAAAVHPALEPLAAVKAPGKVPLAAVVDMMEWMRGHVKVRGWRATA